MAKSWSYNEKLAAHPSLPSATTMVEAMGNLEKAREMGTVLTVLFNSESCDAYKDKMNAFIERVNGKNHRNIIVDYNLRSRNSNGVAYGLLEAAGIKHPTMWQHPKWVTGYTDEVYYLVTERPPSERFCKPGRPCG